MCGSPKHRFIFDLLLAFFLALGVGMMDQTPEQHDQYHCPDSRGARCVGCGNLTDTNISSTWVFDNCFSDNYSTSFDDGQARAAVNLTEIDPCCCGSATIDPVHYHPQCPKWGIVLTELEQAGFFITSVTMMFVIVMFFFELWFWIGCIPNSDGRPDIKRRAKRLREKAAQHDGNE